MLPIISILFMLTGIQIVRMWLIFVKLVQVETGKTHLLEMVISQIITRTSKKFILVNMGRAKRQ